MDETDAIMSMLAAAQADFVRGDAAAFKDLWSRRDDVTILGAFGGYEQGWAAVGARLDWAALQFSDGSWKQENPFDFRCRGLLVDGRGRTNGCQAGRQQQPGIARAAGNSGIQARRRNLEDRAPPRRPSSPYGAPFQIARPSGASAGTAGQSADPVSIDAPGISTAVADPFPAITVRLLETTQSRRCERGGPPGEQRSASHSPCGGGPVVVAEPRLQERWPRLSSPADR